MTNRPNLIVARVGDQSLHNRWLSREGLRNWDLQISFYGTDESAVQQGDWPLSVDRGTKWDSIYRYLKAHPEVLEHYDYLAFVDDDLDFPRGHLNQLFDTCREFDLYVAQPALTRRSYYSHAVTLGCPAFRLRYTNYVESMAPCFKAEYLKEILPDLEGWYSGWGIGRAWALLMNDPERRAAIVDEATMTHTRPLSAGTIYRTLANLEVDPHEELARVRRRYSGVPTMMIVYGGILRSGSACGGSLARIINGGYLLGVAAWLKVVRSALLTGGHMLVRALTETKYRPEQLRRLATTGPQVIFDPEGHGKPTRAFSKKASHLPA